MLTPARLRPFSGMCLLWLAPLPFGVVFIFIDWTFDGAMGCSMFEL